MKGSGQTPRSLYFGRTVPLTKTNILHKSTKLRFKNLKKKVETSNHQNMLNYVYLLSWQSLKIIPIDFININCNA